MPDNFLETAEQQEIFRQKQTSNIGLVFQSSGSAGNNPIKLAQILSVFDFNIQLLGWQNKPLANLSKFLTSYQASLDAKYHNDFKDISIAEEVERKRSERKGISVLQQ